MTEKENQELVRELIAAAREWRAGRFITSEFADSDEIRLGAAIDRLDGDLPTRKIILSGDTGGGARELIISVNGEQIGTMDYEQCGWSFRSHQVIFEALGAALGVPVIDETR